MKVIIQIPCYNEEEFLPLTVSELPAELPGVDTVEFLVIDDGSTDGTVRAARGAGVHHVLSLQSHMGLASAFSAGIQRCLELGADVIVNTDADNQYSAADIHKLVEPITRGKAGMVIGTRPIADIEDFSFVKKTLQRLGSGVISRITGMDVGDAPSGFRAISREAALRLNIFTGYTYTIESIIQARFKNIRIETVPVRVNGKLRESKLVKSSLSYVTKALKAIFWLLLIYSPGRMILRFSLALFAAGGLIGARFLYYYMTGVGMGHVQSLILLSVLFTLGLGGVMISVFAELISVNRRLSEDIQYRLKKAEYGGSDER